MVFLGIFCIQKQKPSVFSVALMLLKVQFCCIDANLGMQTQVILLIYLRDFFSFFHQDSFPYQIREFMEDDWICKNSFFYFVGTQRHRLLLLLLLSHFSPVRLCATHRWQTTRLCSPWDSPGKNTGVGCHFLLQELLECNAKVSYQHVVILDEQQIKWRDAFYRVRKKSNNKNMSTSLI